MVSVVYAVGTSACEAEGMGSTPIGHPLTDASVLLGEQPASKPGGQRPTYRSVPGLLALALDCRRGSTEKGVRLAVYFLWGKHAGANPVVGS